METPVYPRARPVVGCSSSGSVSSDSLDSRSSSDGSDSSNGIVFISTTGAVYGGSDDESDSDSSDSDRSIGGSSTNSSSGESSSGSSSRSSYGSSSGSSSGSERSSSVSNRSNGNSSRTAIELERPEPPQRPSSPPTAYRPPPPIAQACAHERLGYTRANSALPNTASPWGEITARTGIRPPDYSLANVRNNNHNHNHNNNNVADPNIGQPSPAIVPAVVHPPPYHLHLRDRFLETNLAAGAYDPNSPNPPPPAYGVAPRTPFLVNSSARIARSAAAARGAETIDDLMIDLERGDPLRDEAGTRGWGFVDKTWCFGAFLLLFALVANGVALYYSIVHP